ncbi:hypothetical protein AVEN_209990-1 [Araneus ventricosus]|uniref:Uncharacterized protein n=1 Tax=Araneus ventricosus TaxID=182803 RepID=A0A4Y2M1G1_ARAVE|nr:hypothetical protein AVEN_209990-1 [Araneus ventricosus]
MEDGEEGREMQILFERGIPFQSDLMYQGTAWGHFPSGSFGTGSSSEAFSKFKGRSGRQAAHLLLVLFWVLPSPPSDRNIYGNGMHRESVKQPEMEFLRSDKEDPPLSAAKNCSWDQEDSASGSPEKIFGCSFFRGSYWRVFPVT